MPRRHHRHSLPKSEILIYQLSASSTSRDRESKKRQKPIDKEIIQIAKQRIEDEKKRHELIVMEAKLKAEEEKKKQEEEEKQVIEKYQREEKETKDKEEKEKREFNLKFEERFRREYMVVRGKVRKL